MRKVKPGDPLAIRAEDWNQLAEAVEYVARQRQEGKGQRLGLGNGIVRVVNDEDKPLPIYTVVALTGRSPAVPDYDEEHVTVSTDSYYHGRLPREANRPYAVLQEALQPKQVGRAMVYGITPVRLEGDGAFADPSIETDTEGMLQRSEGGSARVLCSPDWESPWGIVLLGCGGGGSLPSQPPLPFELRLRETTDGPVLDIYAPQGTYERFISWKGTRETLPCQWTDTFAEEVPGNAPWFRLFAISELSSFLDGRNERVHLVVHHTEDATFQITGQERVTGEGYLCFGTLKRDGQGTEESPYTYSIEQRLVGAFRRTYAWLGGEGLFVQNGSTLTGDLDSVTWTRDTVAFLCRLYGRQITFNEKNPITIEEACDPPPVAEDGETVFVSKLAVKAHAADHLQDFIPFNETESE